MSVSVEGQAMKLEELINKAGDMKVLPSVARKVMAPPLEDAGTLKVLACVDLSNTICKVLGAGYRAPRETLDLVDHPAISFLDIPVGSASELVTELQESFANEAAYWVH